MENITERAKTWWTNKTERTMQVKNYIALVDDQPTFFVPDNPVRAAKGPYNNGGLALWEIKQTRVVPLIPWWRIDTSSVKLLKHLE